MQKQVQLSLRMLEAWLKIDQLIFGNVRKTKIRLLSFEFEQISPDEDREIRIHWNRKKKRDKTAVLQGWCWKKVKINAQSIIL